MSGCGYFHEGCSRRHKWQVVVASIRRVCVYEHKHVDKIVSLICDDVIPLVLFVRQPIDDNDDEWKVVNFLFPYFLATGFASGTHPLTVQRGSKTFIRCLDMHASANTHIMRVPGYGSDMYSTQATHIGR